MINLCKRCKEQIGGGSEDELHGVVEEGEGHKGEEEDHAGVLGVLHEFVGGWTTGDGLYEEEEDVASIEPWDGQDVHHGQDDADEGGDVPEGLPVPCGGEEVADGSEAAHALCSFLREEVAEVADVALQGLPAVGDTCGNALEEAVVAMDVGVAVVVLIGELEEAEFVVLAELDGDGVCPAAVSVGEYHGQDAQAYAVLVAAVGGEDVVLAAHELVEVAPPGDGCVFDGEDAASFLDTCQCRRGAREHAVHDGGHVDGEETWVGLNHIQQVQPFFGHLQGDLGTIAQDGDGLGLGEDAVDGAVPCLDGLSVGSDRDVAIDEADLFRHRVVGEAVSHRTYGEAVTAPGEENHGVDEQRQEEVDEDAADHDEEALPYGFGAELIGLYGLLHLFGVQTLVNHAGNLDIAAEWNPSDAVLGLVGCHLREEACEPLVLGGEEMEFPVEEHEELLDADAEELGEEEMSALVEYDEEGEAEEELEGFD